MKRAGIYVFYDKNGVVDGYVPYFIQQLHKVADYILVVVNGTLTPEGRQRLQGCSDDLFVRPNEGYDSWGYKEGIEFIGWDRLREYDQLVIANSSIYGPIYPFEELFEKMDAEDCDCWGMTAAEEKRNVKKWFGVPLKWGYKPWSVPSNFHVYKNQVLHSYEFFRFWEELRPIRNYFEACVYMEFTLVQGLKDAGFKWSTVYQGGLEKEYPAPTIYGAYDLITKYNLPIIRKKAFYDPGSPLDFCRDYPNQILRYLAQHTEYDPDLIFENVLHSVNLYDLKNWFNWNCILPTDTPCGISGEQRIACIFHAYDTEIMEQYFHNIASFPDGTDFYITTDTEEKQELLHQMLLQFAERFHFEYRLVENRGRDVSAFLVGCRDVVLSGGYDVICFMHDKKGLGASVQWRCLGRTYSDICFENIAPTPAYVAQVLALFKKEPRLGICVPPAPKNGKLYEAIGGSWMVPENYTKTEKLLRELDINVPIDAKKPPVAPYGSVFWFRPEAVRPLFEREWTYEDFVLEPMPNDGTISHAIERSYGFIAQQRGYYSLIIMSTSYAEEELTRMTAIAQTHVDMTKRYLGRGKAMLCEADKQMEQLLKKAQRASALSPVRERPQRGFLKSFIRAICPIGLWNLIRRTRCWLVHGVYQEPRVRRGTLKSFVRACCPRFLWDLLRRLKCWRSGWVFVED